MVINNKLLSGAVGTKETNTLIFSKMNGIGSTYIFITDINNNVYSNKAFTRNNNEIIVQTDNVDDLIIFVYDRKNTSLLYTNAKILYNSATNKYEIYGYFPTTLKNTTVVIQQTGWQTLQLNEPYLFTN